jgi:hypothetical protein
MPKRFYEELRNWFNGVNTSAAPDMLGDGFSPRARNTYLKLVGDGTSRVAKRRGASLLNATPLTGSPAVTGFQFKQKNGNKTNLLVSTGGRLDKLNSDGTTSVINATAFTSGTSHLPHFAVANDLCFIVNDVDQVKYDGTSTSKFGITRPAAPTAVAGAGGAAGMAGTYDFALSYYNNLTGHESSLSDFVTVVVGAGQKATVTWLAPTDAQVTHVRVHIRKQTLGPNVYRNIASAVPAPDAATGGYAVATLSTVIDIADTTLSAYIIVSPTTTENNPPPSGAQFPTWHGNRMFVFDSGNAYYSKIQNNTAFPEAFDPNNIQPVNPNDGDSIVGAMSMWGKLWIWKKYSLWVIEGSDPNSWTMQLVSNHGAATQRSIKAADGTLFWWDMQNGPVAFNGEGTPEEIGKQFVQSTIADDSVNIAQLTSIVAEVDEQNTTVLWAYPEFNATRNTAVLPFNYRAKRFAADVWTPFDIFGLWVVEDGSSLRAVYIGGYAGQVFKWWGGTNDGVPAGTTSSGTVTAATATTLTDSGATFATAGGGLIERYVYAISSDRATVQRRRITANTATQLTVSSAWDTTPNTTYTYVVGAIDFEVDTPWLLGGDAFLKKRYEFLYSELSSTDAGTMLDIDCFVSRDDTAPRKTFSVTLAGSPATYDASTSIYDTSKFGGTTVSRFKTRLAFTGKSCRIRVRNCQADHDVELSKLAVQSVGLGLLN